jgi:nucleotide-binding universal stress UspA family protein
MYNKILVPLDGSSFAECTIEHVKEIAKGRSVPDVVFLFVVDIDKNAYWTADIAPNVQILQQAEEAQKEGAQSYLKKVVAKAKKDGLAAKGVVVEGSPADAIVDYAQKNGVDLIVMSTHGRSGITRFALGSVTDKVIRTVSSPVLVVTPAECRVKI